MGRLGVPEGRVMGLCGYRVVIRVTLVSLKHVDRRDHP